MFDIGGERYPRFADGAVDFIAFWHKPRHIVVEVAPVVPVRAEPGRAPSTPRIDEAQPHQYVYMVRNKGAKRQPAGFITIGSLIVFLISAYLLHSPRQAGHVQPQPARDPAEGIDRWASTSRSSSCWRWPSSSER